MHPGEAVVAIETTAAAIAGVSFKEEKMGEDPMRTVGAEWLPRSTSAVVGWDVCLWTTGV